MEEAAQALGVRSIRHRSALVDLCRGDQIGPNVVARTFEALARNWRQARLRAGGSISQENWRWCRPQTYLASHNASPEVRLERSIAACGGQWSNQVPVCSGVAGASADRRRAIDLVHKQSEDHFQFIELKIASDTPLYAALEIIGYGCVWLLSRREAGVTASALLDAGKVELIVLAPAAYYVDYQLEGIATAFNDQIGTLGAQMDVELSFHFEVLPYALTQSVLPSTDRLPPLLDQRRRL